MKRDLTLEPKSRTRRKKEDHALQQLGQELVDLSTEQLSEIEMPEELREAVEAAKTMRSFGARRRQILYIGTVLRAIDPENIRNAMEGFRRGDRRKALRFQEVEQWRDRLRQGDPILLEEILQRCPAAQRQRLTQLVRNATEEFNAGKGPKSSRLLFRYLMEVSSSFPASGDATRKPR